MLSQYKKSCTKQRMRVRRNPGLATLNFNKARMYPDSQRTHATNGLFTAPSVFTLCYIHVPSSNKRVCLSYFASFFLYPDPNDSTDDAYGTGCSLNISSYSEIYSRRPRFADTEPCACTFSDPDDCSPDDDW